MYTFFGPFFFFWVLEMKLRSLSMIKRTKNAKSKYILKPKMCTCEALPALKMWQNRNQVQSPHTSHTPHSCLGSLDHRNNSGVDWPWTVSWRWAAGVCFHISGCPGCCGSRHVQKGHRWSQTCVKDGQDCEGSARECQVPGQCNYSGFPQR